MTMGVTWTDLPSDVSVSTTGGRGRSMKPEVDELKARPNTWAIVAERDTEESAKTLASAIRRSAMAAFRDGYFEAATKGGTVYARYVGPRETAETPASE